MTKSKSQQPREPFFKPRTRVVCHISCSIICCCQCIAERLIEVLEGPSERTQITFQSYSLVTRESERDVASRPIMCCSTQLSHRLHIRCALTT